MKNQKETIVPDQKKESHIPFFQLLAYGSGGIIPVALFNIAGQLVGLMGNISLGLSAFWLGVIMIIPRLWDAVSDPIIGHLSDNTRTRWGRRRPYLLIGGILVALNFVVMWWIPKGSMIHAWFPSDTGFHWFQLSYILFALLLFFTSVNIFEIPHGALGMEMTTDYNERTRLFSAKSFIGNLFAMSTPWLFALANMEIFKGTGGNEADGMRYVSIMIACLLIPLSVWWFFKLREPGFVHIAKQKKTHFWKDMKIVVTNRNFVMLTLTVFTLAMGFNFVNLLGSYIPIFYVFGGDKVAGATMLGINGTVWAITGVLAVFPLNWISPKIGKRNTLMIAMALMCLAQISKIFCYNPQIPYLIIIPTILLSTGMLFFFTLGSSMVGDICDEDEVKTGHRSEGSYYAIFWWFIKMGTAFASFVAGALIVFTAFDEKQVTHVDSVHGSIREIQSKVRYWEGYTGLSSANATWIENTKTQCSDAIKESKEYITYLEIETQKIWSDVNPDLPEYPQQKMAMLLSTISGTKTILSELEKVQKELATAGSQTGPSQINTLIRKSISLTLQTKLEKAKMNSFELMSHLQSKAVKAKNKGHYNNLLQINTSINSHLANVNTALSPNLLD
ncbi:MAG: MFS transporter, partial [Bacteroidota bacterium]|nr:MFS transporter [Bacteroidota bacterium]